MPGKDQIDLRLLLASLGHPANAPGAESLLRVLQSGNHSVLQFNFSGYWRPLLTLQNLSSTSVQISRDIVVR